MCSTIDKVAYVNFNKLQEFFEGILPLTIVFSKNDPFNDN